MRNVFAILFLMVCVVNVVLVIMLFQVHEDRTGQKYQFRQDLTNIGFKVQTCRQSTNFFLNFKGVNESLAQLKAILRIYYSNDIKAMEKDLRLPPRNVQHLLQDLETMQQENFGFIQELMDEKDYDFPDYIQELLMIESLKEKRQRLSEEPGDEP